MAEQKNSPANQTELCDLDALAKQGRIVKVGGKQIDVSTIPARTSLELARFADEADNLSNEEKLGKMVELIISVCRSKDPEITVDWILDHTTLEGIASLIEFVLRPLREKAEQGNAAAVQPE